MLENMYVTPYIFGMDQHQEQWKNNWSIALRQAVWCKIFGVKKQTFHIGFDPL